MNEIRSPENQDFEIRIDRNGVWYYNGAEMLRKDIVQMFYDHLTKDDSGRYVIEMPNDRCYVVVEDTPFVVQRVNHIASSDGTSEALQLHLSDEKDEALNPESLYITPDNVLYCSVRNNLFTARFSRAAYYQIADFFKCDNDTERFYLEINGKKYILRHQ